MLFLFLNLLSLATFASIETTVDQVVSAFENASTTVQYSYIENIHDGRGYTAGKAGFTTATGDFLDLVLLYGKKNPASPFHDLLPILTKRAHAQSGSVAGLSSLPSAWAKACTDRKFTATQDELADELYKEPARRLVRDLNLKTPLAYLIIYDTTIQHGEGDDPDSVNGVIKRTGKSWTTEKEFLTSFLKARKQTLLHPHNQETQAEWSESVDRVNALQKLIDEGQWDLKTPFKINVWEKTFTIL